MDYYCYQVLLIILLQINLQIPNNQHHQQQIINKNKNNII